MILKEENVYKIIDLVGDIISVNTDDVMLEIEEDLDVEAELEYLYDYDAILRIRGGLGEETLKKCIIHELTHYKQHVEGRLVNSHLKVYWEGVKYESVDFINSPWEVEAYENEDKYLKLL